MMVRTRSTFVVVAAVLALAGCITDADKVEHATGASGKPTLSYDQFSASPAARRLDAVSDVEVMAKLGVAGQIIQRCTKVKANPFVGTFTRAAMNRATVFGGKDKVKAALEAEKAGFKARHGIDPYAAGDLCGPARRELNEQTAISAFFLDNGL